MGFRINTNINALFSNMQGNQINRELTQSMTRISSGLRLNSAANGSADMAIANQLRSQHAGLGQAVKNSNDAIGVMKIADGALEEYSKLLVEAQTLAPSAVNDTMSVEARTSIKNDIDSLMSQADNIAKNTSYNGINLLDGSFTNKNFQTGAYSGQTTAVSIDNTDILSQGVDAASINVTDSATATVTLKAIEDAIGSLDSVRSGIGSTTINLESNVRNLETTAVNVKAAESQIRDVDYASEQENMNKLSIRQQAQTFALAKSFEVQSLVLNLLR